MSPEGRLGSFREFCACLAPGRGTGAKRSKRWQSCHLSIFLVLPRVGPRFQNIISAQEGPNSHRKRGKSYRWSVISGNTQRPVSAGVSSSAATGFHMNFKVRTWYRLEETLALLLILTSCCSF